MKLADLRRISIKTNVRIRFVISNGMECIVNEHGIAQVPALAAVPDFDLDHEFALAQQFILEPAAASGKTRARPQTLSREQLEALAGNKGAEPVHEEHDE
jgi:hypothetical protein